MKRFLSAFTFIAYSALLVKVMVFKDLPTIRIGQLLFNFGGTDGGHPANFIPLKTIVPYLFGNQGLVIAGVNLLGNVALLVPIGLLAPLALKSMNWKKAFTIAIAAGLSIEVLQATLQLGIFDIDDVILNALGVMVGYGSFRVVARWARSKQYGNIVIAIIALILVCAAALYAIYPKNQPVIHPETATPTSGNLCGNTRGTGAIVAVDSNTITIKRNDNKQQALTITDRTTIKSRQGIISITDLKKGQRVTVVVDDSETAAAVLVCGSGN